MTHSTRVPVEGGVQVRLVDIETGSLAYMQEQLMSARGLGSLLSKLDLTAGRVVAFVADSVPEAASTYQSGSLRDIGQEREAIAELANYLVTVRGLTLRADIVLVGQFAEGPRQAPSDMAATGRADGGYHTAWLTGAQPQYHNGELWHAGLGDDVKSVEALLKDLLWFPAIAVVARLPDDTKLGENIGYEVLADIVQDPEVILVGAWDAMNYLIWTPEHG